MTVYRGGWDADKEATLRLMAGKFRSTVIAKELGLTLGSVRSFAARRKISLPVPGHLPPKQWKTTEIKKLGELAGTVPVSDLCKIFGVTDNQLRQRAYTLKISVAFYQVTRPYTTKELKYLKDNAGVLTVKAMAKELDRTVGSVYQYAFQLGLSVAKAYTPWDKKDYTRLRNMILAGKTRKDIPNDFEGHTRPQVMAKYTVIVRKIMNEGKYYEHIAETSRHPQNPS